MQALLEGFMRKSLAIFLLVAWVVPLLAGILIASARPALWARGLYVGALSPALILPLSLAEWLPEPAGLFKAEFQRALGIAFATITASGTWLHLRLRKQRALPLHAAAPAENQASENQASENQEP